MSETAKSPGRPRLDIDPEQVRKLAEYGMKTEEIADLVGCSRDTLERNFAAEMRSGRASIRRAIRQTQLIVGLGLDKNGKATAKPNVQMLIRLGEVYCGQGSQSDDEDSRDKQPVVLKYRLDDGENEQ